MDHHLAERADAGQKIVFATFGTFGDLHPFLALAGELKRRGHRPLIATCESYRSKVGRAGFDFHPLRPEWFPPQRPDEIITQVMNVQSGVEFCIRDLLMQNLRDSYADLTAATQGAAVLLTHPLVYAGQLVAEKTGIGWISCVLSPLNLPSAYDPPVSPSRPELVPLQPLLRLLGPKFNRRLIPSGRSIRSWFEPLYELRAELGLAPSQHPLLEWKHSDELGLALFSPLLGTAQPDWPPAMRVTGFTFDDGGQSHELPPALSAFLDSGPPPVVFTLGHSSSFEPGDFYHTALGAARQTGCRAVLVTGHDAGSEAGEVPANCIVVGYAPFAELFSRAALVVQHGGIGTIALALRAGCPTLSIPLMHDQIDNAARTARLGVGRVLPRSRCDAPRLAAELSQMLGNAKYAARAAAVQREISREDGVRVACDAIERLIAARESQTAIEPSAPHIKLNTAS